MLVPVSRTLAEFDYKAGYNRWEASGQAQSWWGGGEKEIGKGSEEGSPLFPAIWPSLWPGAWKLVTLVERKASDKG